MSYVSGSFVVVCCFRLAVSAGRESWYFTALELCGLNGGCEVNGVRVRITKVHEST